MLARQLARRLTVIGRDAVHTLDLPPGNRTSGRDIAASADRDGWEVVTKDADVVSAHVTSGSPARQLPGVSGNAGNDELARHGVVIHESSRHARRSAHSDSPAAARLSPSVVSCRHPVFKKGSVAC